VSCGTLVPAGPVSVLLTGLSPSLEALSNALLLRFQVRIAGPQPQRASSLVWPLSLSLAATKEIDVSFSSSGYLDVSVPRVPSYGTISFIPWRRDIAPAGFPHSDIYESMPACGSS
jgi:hypothetical protein